MRLHHQDDMVWRALVVFLCGVHTGLVPTSQNESGCVQFSGRIYVELVLFLHLVLLRTQLGLQTF